MILLILLLVAQELRVEPGSGTTIVLPAYTLQYVQQPQSGPAVAGGQQPLGNPFARCTSCHPPTNGKGGFNLGTSLTPEEYIRVLIQIESDSMPPNSPLTEEEKAKIRRLFK